MYSLITGWCMRLPSEDKAKEKKEALSHGDDIVYMCRHAWDKRITHSELSLYIYLYLYNFNYQLLCNINKQLWASLVAQWLRVRLPMQGTRVRALVWEDPTCRGATGPMGHNYWACASGACALQQERPRRWEARAPRWRVAPTCRNWRKPSHRTEDPTHPKINNFFLKSSFIPFWQYKYS